MRAFDSFSTRTSTLSRPIGAPTAVSGIDRRAAAVQHCVERAARRCDRRKWSARDLRHANWSDAPRPNFTLIYSRFWLKLRYRPIPIPRATYDGLSERARRLFRLEDIGAERDGSHDFEPERFYATSV
jgi:hypothetical protein